jgi:hypothetical protein
MDGENLERLYQYEAVLAALTDSITLVDSIYMDSLITLSQSLKLSIVNNSRVYENSDNFVLQMQEKLFFGGIEALTLSEIGNIYTLAHSCPAQFGTCVYKARTLNAILHPLDAYNDFEICAASLPQNKGGKNIYEQDDELITANENDKAIELLDLTRTINIYPNPVKAQGQLTVMYHIAKNGRIEIHDVTGQLVQSLEIVHQIDRVTFDLGNLAKGIYTVQVYEGAMMKKAELINVD